MSKGNDRDGGFARLRQLLDRRWGRQRLAGPGNCIGAHRLGNVLHLLFAEIGKAVGKLSLHLLIDAATDDNAARLADLLESGRDIHAIAIDRSILRNDIADIDAHAKDHAAVFGRLRARRKHSLLHFDRALDCIHGTSKFDQQAVAGGSDKSPAKLSQFGIDDVGPERFQLGKRPRLIHCHEARIAEHIGGKNCHELSLWTRHPVLPQAIISHIQQ